MSILLVVFTMIYITGDAHAEFDKSGNYVCNPFNTGLETNIYTSTVNQINYKMDSYLNAHPNATLEQQHVVMIQDQKTWVCTTSQSSALTHLG
jgi:hypothetical protein